MIKVNGKEVVFDKFPNGETKLIESSVIIGGYWNDVSFKYIDDSDLIKLLIVREYLDSLSLKAVYLTIYYMPYSRMDRSENDSAFTLKYMTKLINAMNFTRIAVVEPHSDVTLALLDNVEPKYINFDLLPKVIEEVGFNVEEDYIMYPDAGASKRYSKMKYKNVIVGNKNRDFETGKITDLTLSGKFEGSGSKVIIVDDLSSYGGTFVMSADALIKEGFDEIYLLVAHAENSIFKGDLFKSMTKIFTTDTLLTDHNNEIIKNEFSNRLKVYEIEGVLYNEEN